MPAKTPISCSSCFSKKVCPQLRRENYKHEQSQVVGLLDNLEMLDKYQIKKLTKNICKAYKDGYLNEELFEKMIEYLLLYFIESSFREKMSYKISHMNNKFLKLLNYHLPHIIYE